MYPLSSRGPHEAGPLCTSPSGADLFLALSAFQRTNFNLKRRYTFGDTHSKGSRVQFDWVWGLCVFPEKRFHNIMVTCRYNVPVVSPGKTKK